jgi:hypothetical protein
LIVGGIVRRLVTPAHPGDPKLDDPEKSIQFRIEYLKTEFDPAEWSVAREEAFFFPFHSDAEIRAKALGGYAVVASPPDKSAIPEELKPLEETLPPSISPPRETKPKQPSKRSRLKALRDRNHRCSRRDWVTDTYG